MSENTAPPETVTGPNEPPEAPEVIVDPKDGGEQDREEKMVKMYYPHFIEVVASSQTIYGYDAKQIDDELWVVEVPEHLVKIEAKRQFGAPLVKKKPAKKK